MTGAAFEHMLQLGDQSLLDTVMRNVVVFSRMKSHQKGQVMDLLGTRGLYQVIDGQRQHLAVSRFKSERAAHSTMLAKLHALGYS